MKISNIELENECKNFVTQYLKDKSPDTKGTYERALREFQRYFLLHKESFKFKTQQVVDYKNYLTTEKKFSQVTVSTYLTSLRRFCDYLVSKGSLKENPAKKVKGNRRPQTHSIGVLSYEETQKLLSTISKDSLQSFRDFNMISLMLKCAVSEHELVSCNVEDFHFSEYKLFVKPKGKTSKSDCITIPVDISKSLNEYLSQRTNLNPESPLFASHGPRVQNQRLTTRAIRYRIKTWLETADLKRPNISANSLRHTAAYLWLTYDKLSLEEVRLKMRHGLIETTQIYLSYKTEQS